MTLCVWIFSLNLTLTADAQDYGTTPQSEPVSESTTISLAGNSSSAEKPDSEAVRDALLELLEVETPAEPELNNSSASYDQTTLDQWSQTRTGALGEKISQLIRVVPNYPAELAGALAKTVPDPPVWSGIQIALFCLLALLVGLACELFTTRKLLNRLYAYVDRHEKTTSLKFRFIFTRIIIQVIGLAVLGIAIYACGLLFTKNSTYLEYIFVEFLVAFIQFRLWLILLRSIFSPTRDTLRPISIDNATASQLYRWFAVFFAIIEFGGALFAYLERAGLGEAHLSGMLIPYTLGLNLIILSQVWRYRKKITAMFLNEEGGKPNGSFAREFLVQSWPFLFTAWLLLLWMLWLYKAFMGQWEDAGVISKSWWITLAFPVADRMFHGLIKQVKNISWLQSPRYEMRSARFVNIVQYGFRFVLISLAVFLLSQAWGLQPDTLMQDSIGQQILRQLVNLLIIGTIAYIIWELLHALIERNLPEEPDAIASLEGDGGGAGATRAETLLPLMRTVITVILVIFLVLTVLHSLGVAIGPLLAGAGVVGIAIGFGAQKLVQDILSGIFFLVDDAFRRGEYIEIEALKGTVEKISLRSMQLRHHLGAVQTIPYSEVRTVKNLSRDWVTMKLELRLSYDTDIEKVRKLIKKVGQEMLADEEMGPSFILPLKSQGVMRVEESALIVRMKFTTKPGEQWVIRREAYRRVRDALAAANIHFAHREVRVRLPESQEKETTQPGEQPDPEPLTQAAAGAAGAVIAAEAARQSKLDDDGFEGDDR